MTNQSGRILDYLAESHATHIHAKGKTATNTLIQLLECKPGEDILEIGFGTGATIIELASKYKTTNFYGVEASELMHKMALKRLKFCGLSKKINLIYKGQEKNMPYPDNMFDKIYAESIFAIQEGKELEKSLQDCYRILKPGGMLLFNESIWLDSTDQQTADQINKLCKKSFGIIQANSTLLHLKDWKAQLNRVGFIFDNDTKVDQLLKKKRGSFSKQVFLSELFTAIGKSKSKLSLKKRKQWNKYQQEMRSIMNFGRPLLQGVIVRVYKP